MESWDYVSDEKGYVSIEDHHQPFEQLGFPEFSHDLIGTSTSTTVMASLNAISGRGADSNGSHDSSLIDLKLGRFNDHGDLMHRRFSKGVPPNLSSFESSNAPKRARGSGWHSQAAYCQVYGCNKDLSSCKDYHKRHKVCEVHSKTAVVIVNGIEQRFCQQCSRFHLLAEFDDGKRSCRKRLAGHNQRRRKTQAVADSRFQGTVLTSASFISSEMNPSGTSGFRRPIKAEHDSSIRHLSSMTMTNEYPQSRSLFPSYNSKQFPFLHEKGIAATTTGSIFGESNSQQYQQPVLWAQNPGSRSLFQDTSLGSQGFGVFEAFDIASTIQGLSGISDSCCALSLLSSQESSPKSSSHSSGILLGHPLVIPSNGSHRHSMSHVNDTSSCRVSNRLPSEPSPASGSQLSHIMISDNNDVANFEMAGGIFEGSDYVNAKGHLSCEEVATIDLLQLSSQLQRAEHQRQSLQVKQENDSFCTLRIT